MNSKPSYGTLPAADVAMDFSNAPDRFEDFVLDLLIEKARQCRISRFVDACSDGARVGRSVIVLLENVHRRLRHPEWLSPVLKLPSRILANSTRFAFQLCCTLRNRQPEFR